MGTDEHGISQTHNNRHARLDTHGRTLSFYCLPTETNVSSLAACFRSRYCRCSVTSLMCCCRIRFITAAGVATIVVLLIPTMWVAGGAAPPRRTRARVASTDPLVNVTRLPAFAALEIGNGIVQARIACSMCQKMVNQMATKRGGWGGP